MRNFLILIAGAFLLSGCATSEVTKAISYDQQNLNQLKQEVLYENHTARAWLFDSATTNYSKYFQADTDLYGAVWICPLEEAFGKFNSIAQTMLPYQDIRMIQFKKPTDYSGTPTKFIESTDMLKTGLTDYYSASASEKLSLYMVGDKAFIELTMTTAIGRRDFNYDLSLFPNHPGTLCLLFKNKPASDQQAQQIVLEQKAEAERQQKADGMFIRPEETELLLKQYREEAIAAEIQARIDQWDKAQQEQQKIREAEKKRQQEVADEVNRAKKKALADRIVRINSWAKGFNGSYYFQGKSAFDFLRSTLIEKKSITSQTGEVFELKSSRWEILQCDLNAILVHAREDQIGYTPQSQRILDHSELLITRKKGAEPLIEGQNISGFIVLLGTETYTTVLGASKTVPLFQLLEE